VLGEAASRQIAYRVLRAFGFAGLSLRSQEIDLLSSNRGIVAAATP
jgi:hypothetical protein